MTVVESIRNVLSGERSRDRSGATEREQPGERDQRQSEPSESTASRSTNLYRCDPCDATYVSDELESCSQCDGPVERVPTEQDLGLV